MGTKIDRYIESFAFRLSSLFTTTDRRRARITTCPPVNLPLHFTLTSDQDLKVLKHLHLGRISSSTSFFQLRTRASDRLHTRMRTDPARGHGLIGPTGPHHLQRAKTAALNTVASGASRSDVYCASTSYYGACRSPKWHLFRDMLTKPISNSRLSATQ